MQKNIKTIKGNKNTNFYWLYGIHTVKAALNNPRRTIKRMVITKPALEKFTLECNRSSFIPEILPPSDISRILPADAVHQGVAVEVGPLSEISLENFLLETDGTRPLVVLDQVTDPHNVGAILRSAAAFEVGAVVTTRDNSPMESAILAKASCGALEMIPLIRVTNLAQSLELMKQKGFWCIGMEGEAKQTIAQAKLSKKTALILGAEGKGLRRLTAERCDALVRLPISSMMESLNVSNAAAIALYIIHTGSK